MRAKEIPNFESLSDTERITLAEDILGSLKHSESLPPPAAHRVELDRRWTAYLANPASALSKEQFRAQVTALRK
jgi:putative addiction module component (TIGR02574 family)